MKNRILLTLFALPFFLFGLYMLWSAGKSLADAAAMRGWAPVPATLETAGYHVRSGSDSTTYEAYARYRYEFAGRPYVSERVAISGGGDNIGNFQQNLGSRLKAALARGETVTAWVDPDEPANAVLDRRVRWGLVGFKSLFVLLFGGFGAGMLYWAWRRREDPEADPAADSAAPWLANPDWQDATVTSGSRTKMWLAWGFAGVWNAISLPLPFVAWEEVVHKGNWPALLAFLFPLVGVGLLTWAIRCTLEWRRFGAAPLTLDPFPGSIGGHVGGTIDVKLPFDPSARFEVSLTAIRSYVSGSGKNRSRREQAEWQDTRLAHAEPGGRGTRIQFRFDVPEGQNESDARRDDDEYRLWRLNLRAELPGSDLNRDYDIPVYRTAMRSRALPEHELSRLARDEAVRAESRLGERFRLQQDAGGARLLFPAGRHLGGAIGGVIAGLVFAGGGWFASTEGAGVVLPGVFIGVGSLLALASLYMLANSLEVFTDGADLVSLRRVLGIPVRRRSLALHQVCDLHRESTMQSQTGGRHVMYFSLYAVGDDGRKIAVGEGFRGDSEAAAAERYLARLFALRLPDPVPAAHTPADADPLAADY